MNRKLLNGMIVLMAAVCCPASLIAAVAGGSVVSVFAQVMQEPEQVGIAVDSPREVANGRTFIIEIQVQNQSEEIQILDSIDINSEYVNAVTIENSNPPFKDTSRIFGIQTYLYEQDISPGEVLTIQMEAVGHEAGKFQIQVDVCINIPTSCSSFLGETVVN